MLSIAFGQSKYYVDNLSENVKRGNRQKLRRGEWPSKAPYGYVNNPKTRAVDIDPELSKVVKKTFSLFAEGNKSFTEISNFMFKFGMKRESCGKPIKVDQIKRMLSNKFYVGILKYANEYYEGSHRCFISKQLFQEVQKQVEKILRPRQKGHDFAFSGLATCGECGLHQDWEPYFEKWMARDEINDQANPETELQKLGENQKEWVLGSSGGTGSLQRKEKRII